MKKNIAVLFGGQSVEHEISIITALQAIENIDKEEYNVIPVYLTKDNKFFSSPDFTNIEIFKDLSKIDKYPEKFFIQSQNKVFLKNTTSKLFAKNDSIEIDLFFPIVHGTNVEDGKLQGFLSLFNLPIVGPNTLSGAIGQDKSVAKDLLKAYDLPQADYVVVQEEDLNELDNIVLPLTYPLIIKPASLGSSIGIEVCNEPADLKDKVKKALKYDTVAVIENKLNSIREINISMFKSNGEINCSVIEEVFGNDDILSFEDKYISGSKSKSQGMASTTREMPAKIDKETESYIVELSKNVYKCLRCQGVVRLDLILSDDKVYVNEVNSIPGSLSYYLWEAKGIEYKNLLNTLIEEAIRNKYLKENKNMSFDSNVLNMKGSKLKK